MRMVRLGKLHRRSSMTTETNGRLASICSKFVSGRDTQDRSSVYCSLPSSSGLTSSLRLFASSSVTHSAEPAAVVRRNSMLKTGTSCSSNATVPNHVYRSRLFLINAFLSFFVNSRNLKYRQCCSGPARYPVRIRNIGVPATGIRLRGRKMMNSAI